MAEYLFTDLLPEIQPDAPGVNEPAVIRCARIAARYFCKVTDFLHIETNPLLDIVAGQHTYTIPPDVLGRPILHALEVWVGDDQLTHRSADQHDREQLSPRENQPWSVGHSSLTYNTVVPPWRLAEEYPPRFFHQERTDTIRLVGIPDQDVPAALKIVSSVQPAVTHVSVDDYIINNWYEAIVLGTKAHVLQMGQKPWTDVRRGLDLQAQFQVAAEDALGEIVSGFATNDHVVGHVRAYP